MDSELVDQFGKQVVSELTSVLRIGPLPDPRELQEYDRIEPGLANRIVSMAENAANAANAATLSNAAVNQALAGSIREDGNSIRRGQWMFFALAVAFLATAVFLELAGRTPFATGMGIFGFLSLIGVIVRPTNSIRWSDGTNGVAEGRNGE